MRVNKRYIGIRKNLWYRYKQDTRYREKTLMARGKKPTPATIMRLIAASGGHCQFEGCPHNLFKDELTWAEFNNSNVAHIVAASPDGPRGSEESYDLSDKIENLMLLCPTHHKEIDTDTKTYSVKKLIDMKHRQEQKVQELLKGMDYPEAEIVILESPIKGKYEVHIDKKQTVEALRFCKKNPASTHPILLKIEGIGEYSSATYWTILLDKLKAEVDRAIIVNLKYYPELMLGVFPLAPIPLIAKLGELLGDKREIDVFQKTRNPETWCGLMETSTNSFTTKRIQNDKGDIGKVAIILSLTAHVSIDRILSAYNAATIYHICAERNGVDCIASLEDLKMFWQEYQTVCDRIKNFDHVGTAAVFPAIPVSAAFEIGRRHMPGVHPELHIYDDDNGFFEALTIGGK